ncbi:hypothetical protein CRG98_029275, partial [Punica granatum]
LLFRFASSPSLLARVSCNLAGSAHPCEFTFLLRKFAEPARLCLIHSCWVCSPVRVYFSAFQVRRVCSLVPLASLHGLLTCASLLFGFASSPSLLFRANCNLSGSAHPCEFTFPLRKFAEPAPLCLIQSCQVSSPVRVYFFCFASPPSLLACASYILAGSAHPCEFTFLLSKFAESARSCLLHPCMVCSPVRVYFSASQVLRACYFVPIATFPDLLTHASLLFRFASSPSLLACASYILAGSAHPCEFTFLLRKFAETARLCLIQSCRVCSPVRVYFSASQVRGACSLVPQTILPGQLTRASLFFLLRKFAEPARLCLKQSCRVCSPVRVYFSASQVRGACSLVPQTILPGQLTRASLFFLLRKFAEPARSCILPPCRVCSPVRVYFSASQVRRACSLVTHKFLPGLLTRASLLFYVASSPSLLACASYILAGSAHPCVFIFLLRKFAQPARLCILQPRRVCSPVRVYFSASQVRPACSFVHPATSPGLLTRACLFFCFASSPSLLVCASCNLAGSAHPCVFIFLLRKFAQPARLCILQPRRVCSPVRVYFSASQVRPACSFVHPATSPGLLTRACLFFCFASSPSLLVCASCNLAGSAHPCVFIFLLRKFAQPARLCILQPRRVCSPVRVYFSASQVRPACSFVHPATSPGLLTRACLFFCFASSPSLLVCASCNLAGSAHPCVFIFLLRKFAQPARLCILQPRRVCSPVRVYFSASQVRPACSFVHPATSPGLLTRACLFFCFASSPSLLVCASCNLAGSAHPCVFIFLLRKFAQPARLCILQPRRVCSPVRVYFSASQVRPACSFVHPATSPGLLTRACLFFCFASSPSLLVCASCNLAGSAHPCVFIFLLRKFAQPARLCILQPRRVCSPVRVYFSASQVRPACSFVHPATSPGLLTRACLFFCFASSPSLLVCASCNLAGSAHPCVFIFLLRKFAQPARLCILQPRRVCSPVRVYFSASQVRPACSFVHPATSPGLLTRACLFFCFASSPSLLVCASCNLAGSAHPCVFIFLLRKFAQPARLCILQPRRVCSPVRVYFSASQVRPACSFVHPATSPGLLTRACLFFCFASSPSLLVCASCNLAGSAHPCVFIFLLRKFAQPARLCILQPRRVCSPVRVYFSASQVRPACSFVHPATSPGLLTRACLFFCFASSPSLLVCASCNLAGSAHPCVFIFLLRKFAQPARLCILQPRRVCSPVRVYFSASQVRPACSFVHPATSPGLLTRACLFFCFASSPSLLVCASCNLAGSAHPCVFIFLLRKFAQPARLCILQPRRVCSPVRVYFSASQVRPACSFVHPATSPGLLTRACLFFCFASSPSLLVCASCNLAGSAHPCVFIFLLRKFAQPARLCILQPRRVCSPVRVYFSASQVRPACSFVHPATSPGLLTRACLFFCFASSPSLLVCASCNLAGSAHPCVFIFLLRKFAQPARLCILQPRRVCSPVRVYFSASQVRPACSFVHPATSPGLLTRACLFFCFASSPSLLVCASCNLAGSAHPCVFIFLLRKFAQPARLCILQPRRVCSPVRVYFSASQVRPACSFVHPATSPGLLTRACLFFCFASSPSLLVCASCNLAGSAHPCVFIFLLRKFAQPARLCILQPRRVCSPVRVYFSASQVRPACSFVHPATSPGLLTRACLFFCFASSPSLLVCASCNLAGSAHPCVFIFLLRKFAQPARLCILQPRRVCSPVRVYFSASQVRPACSFVHPATSPGLLTRACLFFCFASSPSLLVCASCNLAGSAHPCVFIFLLRKFAQPARLCILQPRRVCSPVRVYFSASQVRPACSFVHPATSPGLLTRACLFFCFASSPSLLVCASCNLAGSAHPCVFIFLLRKFAQPARLCILQPRRVCSPVRVYFSASQVRPACSFVHPATSPGLLTRACLFFCFASSPSLLVCASCNLAGSAHPCVFIFLLRKFAQPARLCILQPRRVCSPVRVYFSASQLACASYNLAGSALPCVFIFLLRKFAEPAPLCLIQSCRVSSPVRVYFFCFASSPSLLACASYNLAVSAHPCVFIFLLRKFAEPARLCLIQSCRVCSPMRVYFSASQVRRACSLVPHTILPCLLTHACLFFCFASSPSLLACASYNLAVSAHPCVFIFLLRKFAEPARLCLIQSCRVCSPMRVYFSASQVRRACSLVPHTILPCLLTHACLFFCFASSPSLLACASYNLAVSAHPCVFIFLLRKFAEPARLCLIQSCRVCSPMRVYFSASQVRRACSLVPHTILPCLLTHACLFFCFASSPSLLACASYNLAVSAHPCVFIFLLRKFAEPARLCLIQSCRVCSPMRVYFSASQVRRACSLVPHTILPCLLTHACLFFCFASSPSLLACASYNLAVSAHPCVFIFLLRKFAEPARLCLIQSCRVCSPMRVYFSASQVRRACSLVPHTILPCLLTHACLFFCFASSPSLLACASYNLAVSAHPCVFIFLLRKFAEPARLCLIQSCRVCSPMRVYFSASQVRRACSLVPHTILPCLLTHACLFFCFASSPSLLACASYNLAVSAHPCVFIFLLRKFAEPARLCLIQSCRVCSPMRVYFSASQVRRACSLVPHTILPCLLTHACLFFCFASSPSLLACASYNLAVSAHPCVFIFLLRKFAEPARLCLIQSCRVCSPMRVYFSASQVRRACSLVPHTILPCLLTHACLFFCFASSPSLLACASYNLAVSAHPCVFIFLLRKFAEPARLCLIQSFRVCSPVRVYFSASQVRRASSFVPHTIFPGLLTRASLLFCVASSPSLLACASNNLAGSAHLCEFTFLLRKFAEPARLCLIQPCQVCSPVRVYFSASQVRRVFSLVPLATLPGLLTCSSLLFGCASSPSLLVRASCNLAGSAHLCEFTFPLRKFAEPSRSCLLQPCRLCSPVRVYFSASQTADPARLSLIQSCRVCSPVRVYFSASQVRRACSLVPHTILPGLLTCASLLFACASSPSLLVRASCNLAGCAHPCEFTFLLPKFAESSRSCLLQPCLVRRACSLVPHTTLPGLHTRASLLFCFASSPSLLPCASYNLAGSAHPCEFIFFASQVRRACSLVPHTILPGQLTRASLFFLLRKFAEPAPLCLIQSCRVSSPVRVYFFCFASSPSLLPCASYNLAGSAHPCEFIFFASQVRRACSLVPHTILPGQLTRASLFFLLRKFAEPAPLCLIQSCRVSSPVRVYFFCFASSPSLLPCASYNLAGSAHPCEFIFFASQVRRACSLVPHTILPGQLTRASLFFLLRKFAEPAPLCLIQSCRVSSPVRVYFFCFASSPSLLPCASYNLAGSAHPCEFIFFASQVRRACSLVPHTILPGQLTRASLFFLLRKFAEPAPLCLIQSCRVSSPVRVYFFCFASSPSLLPCASYNLAGSAHPCEFIFFASQVRRACSLVPHTILPGQLTRASLFFLLRKFAEPAPLCLIQSCRVSSPVRVYFFCFASSPSLLPCASYNLAGSAHPCEFIFFASQVRRACSLVPHTILPGQLTRASLFFLLRKFAEPAPLCLIQSCRVSSPVRVYFFCFASSPSLLPCASYNLAGSAHPCEFIFFASQVRRACSLVPHTILPGQLTRASLFFLLRKFAEPAPLCLIQSCRVSSPVRVYFFCFASSPSLLPCASYNLAGSAHPCEFIFFASQVRRACSLVPHTILPGQLTRASLFFLLRKFAEPAPLCLIQSCRVSSPVRVYFFCFASSPSLLPCASYNLAGSAHPCEFIFFASQVRRACSLVPHTILPGQLTRASLFFLLRKFAEPAPLCLIQSCRVSSPVRVYFFCFASSPSLLPCASYNLAGSAHPCEFIFFASQVRRACSLVPHTILPGQLTRASLFFLLRKFAEPAPLCLIQSCRVSSPVRVYFFCFASSPSLLPCASYNLAGSAHPCEFIFFASQVRRACSLVPHTILPGQLTRASLFFLLRKFAEPAPLCLIQSCRVSSPVRVYFFASQDRRACSFVHPATSPGLLTRASLLLYFASSPSQLACASYNLSGSAHPCEFTFLLRKFAEPPRLCLIQSCRVCSPVRVYFSASQVRRACSLMPIATFPGLLTRASLLFCFPSSPSLLARASCNLAWSAHLCEFTFGLLTRASLLFCFASTPSLLVRASCNLAGSAHQCEFTSLLRKFAEPARLCLIQSFR